MAAKLKTERKYITTVLDQCLGFDIFQIPLISR